MINQKYSSKNIVVILSKLISYKTVTGNNQEILECLEYINSLIPTNRYSVKIITNQGVPNLYAKNKKVDSQILLNGHIDVVPGDESQFKAIKKNNRIYGRGSIDMKGAVAAMISILQCTNGYDLLLTGDEEIGGKLGMKYLLKSGLTKNYEFAISGEPTGLSVATEGKGVMWLTAKINGKSCHAAKPWEGVNPLFKLNNILDYLKNNHYYPSETWKTTITPTLIKSSNGQNQIPEVIEIGIDARYIPDDRPEKIIEKISTLVDAVDITNLDPPLYNKPSLYTDKLIMLSNLPVKKMHWATDARYFEHTPAVIYGPQGKGMHSNNEYVELSSLATMHDVLSHLVNKLG